MKNNRKAINLLCSQFISEIGNWIDRVALLTLVYSVSKSNLQMSILSILILLPAVIFGIPFGKIIDLSNKKTILVFGDISRALLVILVPYFTNYVFLIVFIISSITAIYENTRNSIIPELITKEEIRKINSLSSSLNSVMMVVGPLIGGLLTSYLNLKYCFFIDSFTFLVSAIFICQISSHKHKSTENQNENIRYLEFLEYLKSNFIIKSLIILNGLIGLFAGILNGLLIVYMINYLHTDSKGYGFILTSKGIAMVITSLFVYKYIKTIKNETLLLTGVIGLGISIALFSLNKIFVFALIIYFVNGICNSFYAIARTTIIQENCNKKLLGRVFSFNSIVGNISSIISLLIGGIISNTISVKTIFLTSGVSITLIGMVYFINLSKNYHEILQHSR
ncbi:putative MFS family arabinose efflux permease [Caldicellulosiruptor bescii]|uniref:Major facilitator superfamily MFS_1 n=2 Tax=Caldicellulosiruptor bescii TaxID=31899 RepID=B9MKI9_CALBD|nr:MFS transporter [Caldicellulosiruptor bescii]ACM60847.1 major facilitator superfamily MFS_1 [Caldicellulosiruptor bescii DSM 6725]PBC89337.1 putative MFS family arabinose efflux permease [Caldicellulosiruptor bescii]PBC91178.1 putative MFS family arabinose efflux permease [Caldicellulosiruptor bescii]PBD03408.1 putative MFS family arabinose efflux permease [Caldicellulosiruptor bescii]PBD06977.1 putative MFS family arabinose efflux permease [Caldicellulosiruptor bescii]